MCDIIVSKFYFLLYNNVDLWLGGKLVEVFCIYFCFFNIFGSRDLNEDMEGMLLNVSMRKV